MVKVLQLSSTALSLLLSDKPSCLHQPCFASWQSGRWVFDNTQTFQFHTDALDHNVNTYFPDCDKSEMIRQASWAGTPLDLAYEQLSGLLGETSDKLILTPSSLYSDYQLEYLAGALAEMTDAITVVPLPLAYSHFLPDGRYSLLEVEMRDIVLTDVDIDSGFATMAKPKVFAGLGLQRSYSGQFQSICNHFIDRHRYDVGHVADNKFVLLKQLHQRWSDTQNEVCLRMDDREVRIEKEHLITALPQQVLEQVGDRQHLLIPSQVVPMRHIFSQVEMLPCLNTSHAEALAHQVSQHSSPDGDKVKVFSAIAHRYNPPA